MPGKKESTTTMRIRIFYIFLYFLFYRVIDIIVLYDDIILYYKYNKLPPINLLHAA